MRMYILDENGQVIFELTDLMEGDYLVKPTGIVQLKVRMFIGSILQFLLKQKLD